MPLNLHGAFGMTHLPRFSNAQTRRLDARRRGSLLILTVVVLVLMAIMGAAYMQVARTDRLATRRSEISNLDLVINGIIAELKKQLAEDLFKPSPDTSDDANDTMYDYPWTNSAGSWSVAPFSGPNQIAKGKLGDDTYLAATVPTWSAAGDANASWSHISNIGGFFLDLPALGSSVTYRENLLNMSDTEHSDTNQAITTFLDQPYSVDYEPRGADADGDGIRDSRWTWAPVGVRQLGENSYVTAVRLIDLSSLVNLNAHTAITSDGASLGTMTGTPASDTSSRGYYPTDTDLSRFFYHAMNSGSFSELVNVLQHRNIPTSLPTSRTSRDDAWNNTVRYFGLTSDRFVIADEMELRFRNGLNNGLSKADIEKAVADGVPYNRLPNLLRAAAITETTYSTVTGVTTFEDYFLGGASTANVYDAARTYPAVRQMLTTYSGASALAQNFANINTTNRDQYDLVNPDPALTAAARIDATRLRIENSLKVGTAAYLGLDPSADLATIQAIAADFAVAIEDYSDTNHEVSSYTDTAATPVTHYGMEALPFLREAYIQFGYLDTDDRDATNLPSTDLGYAGPDGTFDTWKRQDNSRAMAVEIANPFDKEIDFSVTRVRIVVFEQEGQAGESIHGTYELTSGTLAARTGTSANTIIVSPPQTPVDEDNTGGTIGTDLVTDLGLPGSPVVTAANTLSFPIPFGNNITVALQTLVGSSWVTYDRLRLSDMVGTADPAIVHTADTTQRNMHVQASFGRDGRKLHYLSNDGINFVATPRSAPVDWGMGSPPTSPAYRTRATLANNIGPSPADALGLDTKGTITNADATLDEFQIPLADRPFLSIAELGWIQMFGFTNERDAGNKPVGDFAERMKNLNANRRTLDFSTTAQVASGVDIPHAAILLSQFTTISPLHDGVDNTNTDRDNNGATNADAATEKFVPGMININTMPRHLLTFTAPLPEPVATIQPLIDQIIAYRDNPSGRATQTSLATNRAAPGISTLSELMYLRSTTPGTNTDMQEYGSDTLDNSTSAVDLYPKPEDVTAGNASRVTSTDTAEERLARFQFLAQGYTTRSDIYAAYVLVRGYSTANFASGIAEEAQFCVIFDRSAINTRTDTPKILGFYRLR